jgi:CRP-like cAMP-binding protein
MPPQGQSRGNTRNRLLDALPPEEYERLARGLEPVELQLGQTLFEPGEKTEYVYFPVEAIISLLTDLDDGTGMEVGLVGREGMVGISTLYGVERESKLDAVQRTGSALRMRADDFREALTRGGQLQRLLLHYAHALMSQISQSVVCNVRHKIDGRFVRWLLMFQDRAEADEFELTHEFMAGMLGVTRSSIGEAVRKLQEMGLVSYDRGRFRVVNRAAMEQMACECYEVVRDEYDGLYKNSPDERA